MRQDWIDIAKGAGIVLVVLGHTAPPESWLCRTIFSFHMPFFFLISGYLFNYPKYQGHATDLLTNRFQRLVLPYLASGMILFIYWLSVLYWLYPENPLNIFVLFLKFLAYGTGYPLKQYPSIPPCGTMWFLVCLFTGSLIFFGILNLIANRRLLIQWLFVCFVSSYGYIVGTHIIYLPWSLDIALTSQVFIFAGYRLRLKESSPQARLTSNPLVILFMLALLVLDILTGRFDLNQRYYGNPLLSFSGAIAGSVLFIHLMKKISGMNIRWFNSTFSYLGKMSLIILIFHSQDSGHLQWHKIFPWSDALYKNWPAVFLFRLAFSVMIIELFKRIPVIDKIFFQKEGQ